MGATDESFLPQIVGLFYATFDPKLGPTVLHQVPDNLITSTSNVLDEPGTPRSRSASRSRPIRRSFSTTSRSPSPSPSGNGGSGAAILDFSPISEYIIPKKSLHGKLVTLLTTGTDEDERAEYRIMGFPSVLTGQGGKYVRNEYMWNLCFVFYSTSSLEAFEPVVRKCARILRSAEMDSSYLSIPHPDHTPIPAVLEQLFEDLNSYSETSIPLDGFNTLELKLFPYYPNPPDCEEWHVPVALVDFNALKDDNWDITASRISQYIDGVNHVRKIAELAHADPALTRETLRNMLYYQVIMMTDIFQYSNMYTLKPSITRLAADETVIHECGAYVTRRGYDRPSWPELLRLYSRLLPGTTVHKWIEENNVLDRGIDPRRFMSFGIIKGFLRRVRRWPILIDRDAFFQQQEHEHSKRRVEFDSSARLGSSATISTKPGDSGLSRVGDSTWTLRSAGSNASLGVSPGSNIRTPSSAARSPSKAPRAFTSMRDSFPRSLGSAADTHPSNSSRRGATMRSGALKLREEVTRAEEEELSKYLDGNHHGDEIQVRFGLSWNQLAEKLGVDELKEGKGKKGVTIIYR